MKVSVHIGAHKTASTHLQHAMQPIVQAARENGTALLLPKELRGDRLAISKLVNAPSNNLAEQAAVSSIVEEFHGALHGCSRAVVSEENLIGISHHPEMRRQGRFYPRATGRLDRLFKFLNFEKVTIYLAVRDPAFFFVSAYSQRLMAQGYVDFETFLGDADLRQLMWSELVGRLIRMPQVERCVIWRFEDYPLQFAAIAEDMLGRDWSDQLKPSQGLVHAGLSEAAYQQLVIWDATEGTPDSKAVRDARKRFPKSTGNGAFMPFDPDFLTESADAYAHDLGYIASMNKVDLISV
ncbi:MAG: hypothetical protein AAF667_19670 [Pseudomonadota bacterium]